MKRILHIAISVLPVLAVLLIVTQVIVSNNLATLGGTMGKLDTAVSDARDTHEALEMKVASASSLLTVRARAVALGFHEPLSNQITSLPAQVPVALVPIR